jgi:hypothetical protein
MTMTNDERVADFLRAQRLMTLGGAPAVKPQAQPAGSASASAATAGEARGEEDRSRQGKRSPPLRQLATVWADAIEISIGETGVVDGLLGRTGMTVLYGESGSGKTFSALDMACHIAAGRPWRGMDVEQGVVVYVAAEAPESVKRRLWAWKRHHGVEHLPVLVVQSSVDLLNGDCAALVALVEEIKAQHGRVALVVVDTLARAMTGNENAPDDMGRFVAACGAIREAGETHVLVVHHSGKDQARGARGHSSLRAATDVELEVTNGEGGGCIKVTKHRDDAGGRSFGFRLETVELGENARGRMVTTCVAVEAEAPARAAKEPPLTAKQRIAFDCLATAIADHGEAPPPARDIPPNVRGVPFGRWEEAAFRYRTGDKSDHFPEWRKRDHLKRTAEMLRARRLVNFVDGWCWLASQTSQPSQNLPMGGLGGSPSTSQTSHHPIKGGRLGGWEAPRANGEPRP